MTQSNVILVVDDVALNRKLLSAILERAGFRTETASSGEEALGRLEEEPRRWSAILLDRMMPGMDGLEVLARIKSHAALKAVPVILQTALIESRDIIEGLRAGAYYYLTKPVQSDTLVAVMHTATSDYSRYLEVQDELSVASTTFSMMRAGRFQCRTPAEAKDLAKLLASLCPRPEKAWIGLTEILYNAIEHGNLGITYEEKSLLNERNEFGAELDRRLSLPENAGKSVEVLFERREDSIRFEIRDEGEGFDWRVYTEVDTERILDTHGRGIAMAKLVGFDELEYTGCGNTVIARVLLASPVAAV